MAFKYKPTKLMLKTSHYDKAKADRAVAFIQNLKHTKGKWSEKPFVLLPWQEQIIRDIFGIVKENGKRQFSQAYVEIPKKNGKQVALDTPIPTPDGFTTMGDIGDGDSLYDENGNVCHVVAKSEVDYDEQAYRITFRDGEVIDAGANHRWFGDIAKSESLKGIVLSTQEIYEMPKDNGEFAFRIPSAKVPGLDQGEYRLIESIVPIKNNGMQCIQVDSLSHLYLIGRSFLPTHNSELAAAVALYLLYADGEASPEVYGAACDRQQASIVYDVAKRMVEMSPALIKRSKVLDASKRLVNYTNAGFYQVLSAEVGTKHGFNVSGLVFDEIHAQPNRKLYDVLTKGSGDAREQPLFFTITTAGTDRNSICYELHTKAKDILKGTKIDPTFYPAIYGLDDGDDWTDENNWYKANPSLGYTIDIDKVRSAYQAALDNPAEENSFKQLRLDMWTNSTVCWIPDHIYAKGNTPIDFESLKGRECFAGLDLSSTSDITAFVMVFPPEDENGSYIVYPHFWLPEDTLALRCAHDHVPYDVWQRQGLINTTEGNVIHYGFIEQYIEKLGKEYNIKEIAVDRWNATQMIQILEGMGFTMVPFGQGYKDMSPPSKELYKLLMEGRIQHGGNPVLQWMAGNVVMQQDPAGNIKPSKDKSTEKIDGIVALIMGLDRCIRHEHEEPSVYDTRGLLFV